MYIWILRTIPPGENTTALRGVSWGERDTRAVESPARSQQLLRKTARRPGHCQSNCDHPHAHKKHPEKDKRPGPRQTEHEVSGRAWCGSLHSSWCRKDMWEELLFKGGAFHWSSTRHHSVTIYTCQGHSSNLSLKTESKSKVCSSGWGVCTIYPSSGLCVHPDRAAEGTGCSADLRLW